MTVEARPSVFHWIAALLVVLAIASVVWVPILFVVAQYFPPEQRLLASCLGTTPIVLLLFPLVVRSGRGAHWSVDLEGLASPVVGRISFSDVASLHAGYPRAESLSMSALQTVVAPGSRPMFDQTLVLRLSDGRLLPVNLLSPTIHGGREVMAKLEELLAGKRHSNFLYSKAEIAALKGRPMNRIVTPKKTA